MKTAAKWLVGSVVFVLTAWIIYPFFVRARKPQHQTFRILKTFAQNSRENNMSDFTRQSVVLEGPCKDGCYGGVLRAPLPENIRQSVSGLSPNKSEATNFVWLRNIKPTSVSRRNDIFGDDELTIYGKTMDNGKNYLAAVPAALAAPKLEWIFVKTNE